MLVKAQLLQTMTWLDNSIGSKIFRLESTFKPFEIRSYLNPNAPLKVTQNWKIFSKGEQSSLRSLVAMLQNDKTFWVILHHCEADYFLVLLGLGVLMVLWRLMDVYAAKVESHPTDKLYFGLTAEMVCSEDPTRLTHANRFDVKVTESPPTRSFSPYPRFMATTMCWIQIANFLLSLLCFLQFYFSSYALTLPTLLLLETQIRNRYPGTSCFLFLLHLFVFLLDWQTNFWHFILENEWFWKWTRNESGFDVKRKDYF